MENYKGDFEMEIKEIIVLKPAELGEEYYKEVFGADSTVKDEAGYRAAVKAMIENSLSGEENFRFTIDARNVIMDKVKDAKLPDDILKEYLIINNKDINESNVDEVYESSKGSLLWDLAKDTLMTQMGIEINEEDVKQTAKMMARQQFAQYGMANPPEEAIDRFADDILKDKKAIQFVDGAGNDSYQEMKKMIDSYKDQDDITNIESKVNVQSIVPYSNNLSKIRYTVTWTFEHDDYKRFQVMRYTDALLTQDDSATKIKYIGTGKLVKDRKISTTDSESSDDD